MEHTNNDTPILYVKADLNILVEHPNIVLSDIIKIYGTDQTMVKSVGSRELIRISDPTKSVKYSVTILKIIEAIEKEYPGTLVMNMGETDFVVEYKVPKKKNMVWEIIKTVFVALAVFIGSAFTIMTFNQDVSVSDVMDMFHGLVMGESQKGQGIIQIFYSIGLPIGIIIFFNHFTKIKIDTDPTPLQVQLRLYEENENKAIIENASREKKTIDVD